MIRSAFVFLALAGCAAAVGCNKQNAGTTETNTQSAKATATAIAPNTEPTSVPSEPPPAELHDESAGVTDPPADDPSAEDPKGEAEDDDNYE